MGRVRLGIRIYSGIGKFSFAKQTNIPDILAILMRLLSDTRKSQRISFPEILLWSQHLRKASVSDFHFPSTCSLAAGRALKFGFSAAILAVISSQTLFFLQFTFLKSFSCYLYWEINRRVSSLVHQKPFLLSTASTLSPEHDAIFV